MTEPLAFIAKTLNVACDREQCDSIQETDYNLTTINVCFNTTDKYSETQAHDIVLWITMLMETFLVLLGIVGVYLAKSTPPTPVKRFGSYDMSELKPMGTNHEDSHCHFNSDRIQCD